jgi:YVTN family beta-propeller protein
LRIAHFALICITLVLICGCKKSPNNPENGGGDTDTITVITTITVGPSPSGVACIPGTGYICVTDDVTKNLYIVSTSDYKIADSVAIDSVARYVIATNEYIYVSNSISGNVQVISVDSFETVRTIKVGTAPFGMALDAEGTLYVANKVTDDVSVISGDSVVKNIPVQRSPLNIVAVPDNHIYVTNFGSNTVSCVDIQSASVTDTLTMSCPYGIASFQGSIYVTNSHFEGTVSVISSATNQITEQIIVGDYPYDLAVTPGGKYLYVACYGNNKVSVVSTENSSIFASVSVGKEPVDIDISPDGKSIYVANHGDGTISVIGGPGR